MDTKTIGLIGTIVKVVIALLGSIFCVLIIANSDAIKLGENMNYLDMGLAVSYIAMFLCVGIALLFGLFYFIRNIGKSKGMLFALVGFVIVLAISYAMAEGNMTMDWQQRGVTETVSKLSSMGIWATFILLGLAIVLALVSEVSKMIK